MFFNNRQMTGNPTVDRLITERDQEHVELHALREELQVIQDVIRSKQERLRKMNQRIIQRQNSQHYLKVASSQPAWRVRKAHKSQHLTALYEQREFRCVRGGKPTLPCN